MPLYTYRCRACGTDWDAFRAVDAANDAPNCPDGHDDTVRMLSLVARRAPSSASTPRPATGGGGCCGGGCGCG